MANSGTAGQGSSSPAPAPKILLAKPGLVAGTSSTGKFIRGAGEDDSSSAASIRSRLPPVGSLNLLSDSWDFHFDRFLPFLTDNTEFTVVGVIGPPGVGKSTIMNELYGFDPTSPGMLPPFATQSEETRANARHCTVGIEPRISSERIILLDTQPVFSPSILAEITRPDGSSTVPVLSGETLPSELAYELMNIQVDLLKHAIPDPSSVTTAHSQSSNLGTDKDSKDKFPEGGEEYMATPIFIHTRLRDEELGRQTSQRMREALVQYFHSSSFTRPRIKNTANEHAPPTRSYYTQGNGNEAKMELFLVPLRRKDNNPHELQYESYDSMLWKIRGHVLSMTHPSFSRTVTERDWLKNTAKIWELVKNSPIIAEYCKMLQSSGLFRK
ncbi:hypothetical protein Cgig2_017767 [Carnegiea gigantea]|uniref:Protein SMG9 n=1 Tax=Carnegiea gigantea TaxID=171969 RepID=A0A9Q1KUY0_9CARY|nr:hypothetical protein Cgig2_017767 [Carnegiea gigantea]